MDSRSHSPIKALFRNHSPFRNKDKPLPDLPVDVSVSPAREPGAEISANVAQASPPRRGRSSGGFLAKLLGSTKTRSGVTASQQAQPASNYVLASEVRTQAPPRSPADEKAKASRSPIRKNYFSKSNTSDPIRTLSRKVSDLESQLNKARRELDAAAGRKQSEPQDQPAEYERKMEEKVQSLSQRGRFNGLVENLLGQAPVVAAAPQASTTLSPSKEAGVIYAGPAPTPNSPSEPDNNLKRKRSVPDTPDLSWEHMQKNIAAFQMQQKVPNKRARTSSDSIRDEEPVVDADATGTGQAQAEADAKKTKKKAHRDMPVDPTAFNKLIRLDREQEAQKAKAAADQKQETERDTRPKSRRSTKKPAPDFSSFGQSSNTTTTNLPISNPSTSIPALSPSSIHLRAWPAPHSLSRAFSPPAEASSSPPPASSPVLDACAPHLPPSLAATHTAASGPDLFELHSDSDSSDSSDEDDADAATRRDRRRADVDAWRAAHGLGGDEDEDSEEDEDEEGRDVPLATLAKPPVRKGRLVPKPSRLSRVVEEFEWDDGETF